MQDTISLTVTDEAEKLSASVKLPHEILYNGIFGYCICTFRTSWDNQQVELVLDVTVFIVN